VTGLRQKKKVPLPYLTGKNTIKKKTKNQLDMKTLSKGTLTNGIIVKRRKLSGG